jgi:hypothetical protein
MSEGESIPDPNATQSGPAAPPDSGAKVYEGEAGLREAAAEMGRERAEAPEPKALKFHAPKERRIDPNRSGPLAISKEMGVDEAARQITEERKLHHARLAREQAAFDEAMGEEPAQELRAWDDAGEGVGEPTGEGSAPAPQDRPQQPQAPQRPPQLDAAPLTSLPAEREAYVMQLAFNQSQLAMHLAQNFPEVKSKADLHALAQRDPARYVQCLSAYNQAITIENEIAKQTHEGQRESAAAYDAWAAKEDAAFRKANPELNDPQKFTKLRGAAMTALNEVGVSDAEIAALWSGSATLSLRDSRAQQILIDAAKYRALRVVPERKPVPPVHRPGTASLPGARAAASVADLTERMKSAKGNEAVRLAVALRKARRGG